MNKFIKISSLVFIISIISYSCSQDDLKIDESNNQVYELEQKNLLKETTSNVSSLLLNMGVTKIEVKKNLNSIVYNFETAKEFRMNEKSIDLARYSIILENGKISIDSNSEMSLTIMDDEPYVITPDYSGFIESENMFKKADFNILLLFMKEMITENKLKVNAKAFVSDSLNQKSGCSFWNTYYVYSTGGSRSVSEANLPAEIQSYSEDLSGCTEIGGTDSSCLWENHGCVASQAFCCN